ncbi:unnamed protein product [Leptosia nina]|uniref:Uncharacterized protein n=1 Tax=Leptosia nina TaxID=320188 RepID=A0AAV1K455_9NEOP
MRAQKLGTPAARPARSSRSVAREPSVSLSRAKVVVVCASLCSTAADSVRNWYSENCACAFSDESSVCACDMCYCFLGLLCKSARAPKSRGCRERVWIACSALAPVTATVSARRSPATRPARPATAVDNLGQSPLPVKRLHEALQSAQVKRQRLSPPYPSAPPAIHPIHQLAVHQHIKVQQSIVQQSIVQQHQLNLAHQSLQNLQAQSIQAAQSLQAAQGLQAAQSPVGSGGTQQSAATQGALVPPQQPSPRAASPQHKTMELALCQSMDSVNTATTEEEVSVKNSISSLGTYVT